VAVLDAGPRLASGKWRGRNTEGSAWRGAQRRIAFCRRKVCSQAKPRFNLALKQHSPVITEDLAQAGNGFAVGAERGGAAAARRGW